MFAADGSALLKSLAAKYSSAKNVVVKFSESEESGKIKGTATVAGKTKFRVDLGERLIVCNGTIVWNYTPADKRVTIDTYHPGRKSLSPEFFIAQLPADAKAILIDGNKPGEKILQLDPPTADAWGVVAKLIVEVDEHETMLAVTIIDDAGSTRAVRVLSTKFDQTLPADIFDFKLPAGSSIIDLR